MNRETETLALPTGYSLGRITVYEAGNAEPAQPLDARGAICIPKGATLFLDLSQEVCDDLSRIHFVPERLLDGRVSFLDRNLDKTDLRKLLSLRVRSLIVNSCSGIRLDQLCQLEGLTSLEHLNLERTPLDISDFSWILQFPNLKTLLLSGPDVADNCLPFISALHDIHDLHLTRSRMTDQGVRALWEMRSLQGINLDGTAIGDDALDSLGCCSHLRRLKLSDTRVSDTGVEVIVTEALEHSMRLSSLSLRSCRITNQALVRLASLTTLVLLDLFGTDVTAQGAAFLKSALPKCTILVGRDRGGGPELG
jgi:Leucine Rich repeat